MGDAVFAGDELPILLAMRSRIMLAGPDPIVAHITIVFLVGFHVLDVDSVTYSHINIL